MKNIISIFVCVVVIVIESCFIANEFKSNNETESVTETNSVAPSIISEPCVLQDAVMHDGIWFLYDKPVVFDEEACEVMSAIFADQINAPIAAIAEFIDGVYVMHLD